VSLPEVPYVQDLPPYHDLTFWGPVFQALSDERLVMCLHIGQGFAAIRQSPGASFDNLIILATQVSVLAAQDLLWGRAMRDYPDLKIAWSEAGIGWIPFYLDRCDRHYTNQVWLGQDFGGKLPSEVFKEHSLACFVTDPTTLKVRHDIGIDTLAWECDYPHSDSIWPDAPEFVLNEMNNASVPDDEIHKITWENATRFFDWDPFTAIPKDQANVGSLRAQATDVDTSTTSRAEWRKRYEAQAS
jgi:predicted TIM-barrel fold metal-dependent hydrolase